MWNTTELTLAILTVAILAALVSGNAEAACDHRPSLPEPLSIDSTANSIKLRWTPNGDARFFDLNVTQKSNNVPIVSITGGLENQRRFDVNNLPPNEEFEVSFTPRTEAGSEGCIAAFLIRVVVRTQVAAPTGAGTGTGSAGPGASSGGCSGLAGEDLDICNEHNVYRAKHGVPQLTWSADLARNAQQWVDGCHKAKNTNNDEYFCHQSSTFGCGTDTNYRFGENLSFGWPSRSGKEAARQWYCEWNVYNFDNPSPKLAGEDDSGTVFGDTCDPANNPKKVTGHFTQVVWRATTKIGCAKNTCSQNGNEGTLWACEYDPPGNFNAGEPGVLNQNVPKAIQGLAPMMAAERSASRQTTTAIISDVDLYDIPGGVGNVIGILRQGQTLPLYECQADDWCRVEGGWVWGAFLVRSHVH
ncbi:CAP domain-containing protein [Aminobacter sp. AP02]|uniref:CAP domain-containing protein n=1 Tax=Aminobacter sp. AP02 TaxID=2135737 RepID=UPI000D6D3F82|nr:CAP domain-containing protein [Aminobacter sp. AP02]PWK58048.1 uncharacterized protein YkwD [Aminobacter sp. AP02]